MSKYSNKRIAKNTIILYYRMAVFLVVSLFTARIIYNTLGVEDYGTFNLVAGIIVFFSFLNNGLSAATKRYITAEIGKDFGNVNHVFNICLQAHIIIAVIVLICSELIGVWVLNNWLNIPSENIYAANWVFQISIIMTMLGIVQSPFGAVIIAHERMGIYAYITVIDVILKLLIVFLIQEICGNKLIIYSILLLCASIISFGINYIYCQKTFKSCQIRKIADNDLLKKVFSFMSWSILGQVAVVGTNQGISVLINIFYSVVVNAALGISNTITNIVSNFVSNFQIAFNPQIIKLYNNKDYSDLNILIIRASKISSYLIIIFLVPICFETDNLLTLWLGNYPQYSAQFVVLTLFSIYFECIGAPLWMTVYSQSKIKIYQIIISVVYSLNFFVGWLILYIGGLPYSVMWVRICVFIMLIGLRLFFVKKYLPLFSIMRWLKEVLFKSLYIIAFSLVLVGIINQIVDCNRVLHIVVITALSLLCTIPLISMMGLDVTERKYILNMLKSKIRR